MVSRWKLQLFDAGKILDSHSPRLKLQTFVWAAQWWSGARFSRSKIKFEGSWNRSDSIISRGCVISLIQKMLPIMSCYPFSCIMNRVNYREMINWYACSWQLVPMGESLKNLREFYTKFVSFSPKRTKWHSHVSSI